MGAVIPADNPNTIRAELPEFQTDKRDIYNSPLKQRIIPHYRNMDFLEFTEFVFSTARGRRDENLKVPFLRKFFNYLKIYCSIGRLILKLVINALD
jgi:hypothetical protein